MTYAGLPLTGFSLGLSEEALMFLMGMHAEGISTVSVGIANHAEGLGSLSAGGIGVLLNTSDDMSEEEMLEEALGAAHTEGLYTLGLGTAAHAEGQGTLSIGDGAHAEGVNEGGMINLQTAATMLTKKPEEIFSSWSANDKQNTYSLASGKAAHVEGINNLAAGVCSHAEGKKTAAIGYGCHVEGCQTEAHDDYSHAEGHSTRTTGKYGHSEGL
jgi:hypothetical protein